MPVGSYSKVCTLAVQMGHEDYGHTKWKAEDMAAFLRDKTGVNIEKIDRPSFSRSGWFPVLVLAIMLTGTARNNGSLCCHKPLCLALIHPAGLAPAHQVAVHTKLPICLQGACWRTPCTTRPS